MSLAKKEVVPNYISLKVNDGLFALIAREADKRGTAMIDVVVSVVAEYFERPELGVVPRKRQGRKRTKYPEAEATNGKPKKAVAS